MMEPYGKTRIRHRNWKLKGFKTHGRRAGRDGAFKLRRKLKRTARQMSAQEIRYWLTHGGLYG